MTKVVNNPNMVRFDLYLSIEADARLIAHLEGYKASRRIGQELRRMLYQALDGYVATGTVRQAVAVSSPGPAVVSAVKSNFTAAPAAPEPDIKAKLRGAFGKPS